MKRIFPNSIIAILFLFLFAACEPSLVLPAKPSAGTPVLATTAASINILTPSSSSTPFSNNKTLLFLGNENIAPVLYLDGTNPAGISVDIVNALAKYIPEPIEIKAMDWTEAQALVAQGEADALIQINPSDEREKIYDFSDPLLESHFSIFTNTNRMGLTDIPSLHGLNIGVESGGLPQQLIEKDPQIRLTIIPNFLDGFKQLNNGSIDAVIVDYRVGTFVIAQNNLRNIKVTGDPISSSYSYFAVKKGNSQLLNEINFALQKIKADGTYQNILDNWKPTEVVIQTQEQITNTTFYATTIILLIFILIAVIWIVTIRKELNRRKRAEEIIRESEERFRLSFENSSVGKSLTAFDGRMQRINQAFASMLGYTRSELEGKNIAEITHPDDVAASNETIRCLLAGERETSRKEKRYFYKNGNIVWADISSTLLLDSEGKPRTLITDVIDITDRKHAEEELRLLNEKLENRVAERTEQLEAINQKLHVEMDERLQVEAQLAHQAQELAISNLELERFASIASHDLQEPLRKIESFGQLLDELAGERLGETERLYLERIRTASERMRKMIEDLLSLSRVSSAGTPFTKVDLNQVIQAVQDDLEIRIQKAKGQLLIDNLPPVLGDPAQMQQLFLNLIGNAMKFHRMNAAPVVKIYARASSANRVEICVEDNGIGFDMAYADRIFQPFQRLHGRSEYEGTGIGLSICRKIVERHGGKICVQSQPGQGTTFSVDLPLFKN